MENLMFDSFRQWTVCMGAALKSAMWGGTRIAVFTATGLLSLLRALWRRCISFVGNYPTAATIAACGIILAVWVITFTDGRAKLVTAEHERDSLSYQLHMLTITNERGEQVVIGNDTIKVFSSYDRP